MVGGTVPAVPTEDSGGADGKDVTDDDDDAVRPVPVADGHCVGGGAGAVLGDDDDAVLPVVPAETGGGEGGTGVPNGCEDAVPPVGDVLGDEEGCDSEAVPMDDAVLPGVIVDGDVVGGGGGDEPDGSDDVVLPADATDAEDAADVGGGLPSTGSSNVRRLCCRLPNVGGRGRWIIAGPVHDNAGVDPLLFSMAAIVEGLPSFTSREVYVRALPGLIKMRMYPSTAAAYQSVQHVSNSAGDASLGSREPSWLDVDAAGDADLPVRRILDRAVASIRKSGRRVDKGFVKFVSTVAPSTHPWHVYRVKQLRKQDERRGAVAYRRSLSRMTHDDERRMLRAGNCSTLSSVRHATTYTPRTPAERAKGLRATKKRPWRGVAAPDIIPTKKGLVGMKRRVFERCNRVGHSMITLAADGTTVVWAYVRGSGLTGVRLYKSPDGTVKRLASHSHKQRKSATATTPAAGPGSAGDADEAAPDPLGESCLGDGPPQHVHDWRLSLDQLRILKRSSLENVDGSDPEVIVAVEFDIVASLRAAIQARTLRCTVEDVEASSEAWSLASDGGPIRRSVMTLFTLSLSASWLAAGRTAMLPVLYILGGEHQVHSALGARLDALVAEAVTATYGVRVHSTSQLQDEDVSDGDGGGTGSPGEDQPSFCSWRGPYLVRIVGDFSMIAHLMALTGGNDDWRCPFSWPCVVDCFLSLTALANKPGHVRTAADIALQWELVSWILARWCSLRGGLLSLNAGQVTANCTSCSTLLRVFSPDEERVTCAVAGCGNSGVGVFPPVLPTPLGTMFNLLRRSAGGLRGYPVLRTIPVILQVPVLHCTGNIMKKLTFFFLAELGESRKTVAKRGIYAVTGRANVGSLYLREHVKLVALLLACEEIVVDQVDSAILTMWSLALLMTAAWRTALAGPMEQRNDALAVMELAAGLLAPLWSSLKPLDKEKKSAGVASLYIHAALAHARESMGDRSPAEAVLTDDHVEGQIREMSRHNQTRVNNVSRAQAVTELHALGDDQETTAKRNRFAAELKVYTKEIHVCGCCSTKLDGRRVADMKKAVERAGSVGAIAVGDEDDEEGAPQVLSLPSSLVYTQEQLPNEQGPSAWMSKERMVSHALAQNLSTLHVCLCGAARGREPSALVQRLTVLQNEGESPPRAAERLTTSAVVPPVGSGRGPVSRAGAPVLGLVEICDARSWMCRHSDDCVAANDGDCDGSCDKDNSCGEDCDSDDVLVRDWVRRGDDLDDAESDDMLVRDWPQGQGDADCRAGTGAGRDALVPEEDGDRGGCSGGGPADVADADVPVPVLSANVMCHPALRPFAPPLPLLKYVLDPDGGAVTPENADACRFRILEEDMLLRMFLVRMQGTAFKAGAAANNIDLAGMRDAVTSVLHKLADMRVALPGGAGVSL